MSSLIQLCPDAESLPVSTLPKLSNMRRTTHFYVMVLSLYLILLKAVRSDCTDCCQRIDPTPFRQNTSFFSDSESNLLFKSSLDTELEWITSNLAAVEKLNNVPQLIKGDYANIKTSVKPSLIGLRRVTSPSKTTVRLAESEGRYTTQIEEIRGANFRSRVTNRRTESREENEKRFRRNMEMNENRYQRRHRSSGSMQERSMDKYSNARSQSRSRADNVRRRENQDNRGQRELQNRHGNQENRERRNRRETDTRRYNTVIREQRFDAMTEVFDNSQAARNVRFDRRRYNRNRQEHKLERFTETCNNWRDERRLQSETRNRNSETRIRHTRGRRNFRRNVSRDTSRETRRREAIEDTRNRRTIRIDRQPSEISERSTNIVPFEDVTRIENTFKRNDATGFRRHDRIGARVTKNRQAQELNRANLERRRVTDRMQRRDAIRTDELRSSRTVREQSRQIGDYRGKQMIKVRGGSVFDKESYHNSWIWDEAGISRAIVVGFLGILGRRLWQKQI